MKKFDATLKQVQTIKNTLYQIFMFFVDLIKISELYKWSETIDEIFFIFFINDMSSMFVTLNNNMKKLIIKRPKKTNLENHAMNFLSQIRIQKCYWKYFFIHEQYRKKIFAFPIQIILIRQKTIEFHDRQILKLIESVVKNIDNLLQNVVKKIVNNHRYLNLLIKKKFKLKTHLTIIDIKKRQKHFIHMTTWWWIMMKTLSSTSNMIKKIFETIQYDII